MNDRVLPAVPVLENGPGQRDRGSCDLFGPSVRSFFETVSAVLVAGLLTGGTLGVLTALACDKHRQRAAEMLVVGGIVFALIGVAVPMTQSGISEAPRAKARQDLDTIRNAITLHDSQTKPLVGSSPEPKVRPCRDLSSVSNRHPEGRAM